MPPGAIDERAPGAVVWVEGFADARQLGLAAEERLEAGEVVEGRTFCRSTLRLFTGWRRASEPFDNPSEVPVCVESMIALEMKGNALRIVVLENDDADIFVDAGLTVNALTKIIRLAGRSHSGAGLLFPLETEEPRFTADDDHALRLNRAIAAPFRPAIGRTTGLRIEIELIKDHFDPTIANALGERADTLALRVIDLSVTDEDCGHEGIGGNVSGNRPENKATGLDPSEY